MLSGLARLVSDFFHGKRASFPEEEHLDKIRSDPHFLRVYLELNDRPRNEEELLGETLLPKYKLDEYLEILRQRNAVRKQYFGDRYVLTPQGDTDIGVIEDLFLNDIVKHLSDVLSPWQKMRVKFSMRYAAKMLRKYTNNHPYPPKQSDDE